MSKRVESHLCAWVAVSVFACAAETAPTSRAQQRAAEPTATTALAPTSESSPVAHVRKADQSRSLPLQAAHYDGFVMHTVEEIKYNQWYTNNLEHGIELHYQFLPPPYGTVDDDAVGTGWPGVLGVGSGGSCRVQDLGAGPASAAVKVQIERAEVRGPLSKTVISRIVQRHIHELRFCYEQQLNLVPSLRGRVVVKFIISGQGQVVAAALSSSTLGEAKFDQCVVGAVKRWNFTAPEKGGSVVVSMPFVFTTTRVE
jgi:TonB family protein